MTRRACRQALHAALYALAAACVSAQERAPMEQPTERDIIDALRAPARLPGRARNLVIESPPAIDLSVGFELNSARLDAKGRRALHVLAAALKSEELTGRRFRVEGHTDATGRAEYNQALSERRAASVVAYLVEHGVARSTLEPVGKGQNEPLIREDPRDGRNRRVRVAAMEE